MNGNLTKIRALELDDLKTLYEWYNNPDFSYWTSGSWPMISMLRREEFEEKFYDEDVNRYAVTDIQGNLIGTIGFDQVNIPARSARLYLAIGLKELWGKGYGTDCLTVFVNYLFYQWNFHRLTAETWDGNERALHCYTKMGFVVEGQMREAYYINGKYRDGILLSLLKKDFHYS